jgi:hypothetical protein
MCGICGSELHDQLNHVKLLLQRDEDFRLAETKHKFALECLEKYKKQHEEGFTAPVNCKCSVCEFAEKIINPGA